ncbi:MAG TPA: type II toxin-antitoxin system VapC family toxin [Bauldia sp.]|nr:type II toxin-antitoxin system VapC family toxin [Bauldia sp.]
MTRYLLDTNIVSHLIRHPFGPVAVRVEGTGEENVVTSVLVAAEIHYGLARKGSRTLIEQAETVLGNMRVLPFASPAELHYGAIRAELEARGEAIGANDLFIAAHARALGCILVTDNMRELARVPSLAVENWLR